MEIPCFQYSTEKNNSIDFGSEINRDLDSKIIEEVPDWTTVAGTVGLMVISFFCFKKACNEIKEIFQREPLKDRSLVSDSDSIKVETSSVATRSTKSKMAIKKVNHCANAILWSLCSLTAGSVSYLALTAEMGIRYDYKNIFNK